MKHRNFSVGDKVKLSAKGLKKWACYSDARGVVELLDGPQWLENPNVLVCVVRWDRGGLGLSRRLNPVWLVRA